MYAQAQIGSTVNISRALAFLAELRITLVGGL